MTATPPVPTPPPPPPVSAPIATTPDTSLTPGVNDPYQLDPGTIGAYEFQAQALNQASIASYGAPINPQSLLEVLKTGASEPTLAAIASGDPEYASLLSAAPAGLAPRLQTSAAAGGTLDLSKDQMVQSLYTWNADNQKASQELALKSDDQAIRALGETPVMNVGYINGVKSGKDTGRTKNWQLFLKSHGLLSSTFQVTGQWDGVTDKAFTGYMAALFMPEALFGKNQERAKIFQNELGIDVPALIKSQGRDGLQNDAFLKWIQTQDTQHARKALSTYVEKYGQGSIPDKYKNLTGSWVDDFQDTLTGIPLIGNVLSPIENLFSINKLDIPTDLFKDNRSVREDYALKALNPNEKQALESVATEAKHSVGWFGALDGWDRAKTRMVLGLLWDFHDHGFDFSQFHNPIGTFSNNFDVSTDYGKRIAQGQTDMFGHIPWAADWFNQHETLKGLANFTANVLDDPTSYTGVGFIGKGAFKAASLAHDAAEGTTVGGRIVAAADKVWQPFSAKDWIVTDTMNHLGIVDQKGMKLAWDKFSKDHLDQVVTNTRNTQALNEMGLVLMHPDVAQHDMAHLLHMDTSNPAVEDAMADLQRIARTGDHNAMVQGIVKYAGEGLQEPSFAHNYYEALRGITPVMTKRMSLGRLQRMMAHGSQQLNSPIVDTRNPLTVMEAITAAGHALGMQPAEIRPFLKKIEDANKHPDHIADVVMEFGQQIAKTFTEHPEWSKIEFEGHTGLDAFNAWQRRARINPADVNEVETGSTRVYAPEEKVDPETGQGTGAVREASTAPAKGTLGRVHDAINTNAAIANTAQEMMSTIAHYLSSEEMAALGAHGAIDETHAAAAVTAFRKKVEATVDPAERARMSPILHALESQLVQIKTFSHKLGQLAPDGESVASAAFTSQLRYRVPMYATPAEIMAFVHPTLRGLESVQNKMKLDSMRSFWSQAEIARVSSAFRITLGDEVSRFFFALLLNGQSKAAFRYLGQMGAGIPLKVARKAGITERGAREIDPAVATSSLGLAAASSGVGQALHHPGTKNYNKALARAIWYTFGKDKFTQEWMQHMAPHLDVADEMLAAEGKWYTDHAAAQAHLDTAHQMLTDRGLTGHADNLQKLRDAANEKIASADEARTVVGDDGKTYVTQFGAMGLDKLGAEFRQGRGDKQLLAQLHRVEKLRQPEDVDKLRDMMVAKGVDQHYINILDEEYVKAAHPEGIGGSRINTHTLRSELGNHNQERATRMLHRQILLTENRAEDYQRLADALRSEHPEDLLKDPEMARIWREWSPELTGTTRHSDIATMIDSFLARNNNYETLRDMNRMRKSHGLSDLLDARPMGRVQGSELMDRHVNIATSIRDTLANPDLSEEDLVGLNNSIREVDPSIGQWNTDLRKNAEEQLKASDSMVKLLRQDPRYFGYMSAGQWAERQHSILANVMKNHNMMKWVKQVTDMKHADPTAEATAEKEWVRQFNPELQKLLRPNSLNNDNLGLPLISQPLATHENMRGLRGLTQSYFNHMHHDVTGAMVNYARQVGMETIRAQRLQLLEKHHPEWFKDGVAGPEAEWRANSYALAWVKRNTYQGQRTVMGGVMRNAFPFWGATANMSRFWMRQVAQHKHFQSPFFHTLSWVDQTQASGGMHLALPWTNWMMSKVTGNQGEDMTVDPLKPFFFTSDGIGGFVPGMGPFLSLPLDMMASHDPEMVDGAMQAFGPMGDVWKQHITGSVSNPLLSWTPGVFGGAYEALTGHTAPDIPLLTNTQNQQESQVLAVTREQQAQRDDQGLGSPPDPAAAATDATKSAGMNNLITGMLSFLLPVGAKTEDAKATAVKDQLTQWDTSTTAQKTQMIATAYSQDPTTVSQAFQSGDVVQWAANNPQNPANLLLYFDRRTSEDDKRSIAFLSPWVVAYSTSKYDTTKSTPQVFSNAQEFGQAVNSGDISTLDPANYVKQIDKNRQYNQAWAMYGLLKQKEYAWLRQTGNSSQSPQAKAYREHFFDPQFNTIIQNYPDWAAQFASQSRKDLQGLLVSTRPISSVMSWEVIPQFGEMDTQKTALWRQVFRDKEDAVSAIREARASGATGLKMAEQEILGNFQSRLVQYAQVNSDFAAELDQFHYGRIEDLITLEAMGNQ